MRARMSGKSVLGALCSIVLTAGSIVMASPASAETINITIPSPTGSPQAIGILDTQGVAFSGNATRTCVSPWQPVVLIDATTSNSCGTRTGVAYLEIDVPNGTGFDMTTGSCSGSCPETISITFKRAGTVVSTDSLSVNVGENFSKSIEFDQVRIDVPSILVQISSFSFTVSPTPTTSTALHAPLMQGVALPTSGDCMDVNEEQLSWASTIAGGWSKSWQTWYLSADSEVPPWQGWACIRTLGWTVRGWTPIS